MRKYLVNSTYCIYLTDLKGLYFDDSISTIKEVVEEIKQERGVTVGISLVQNKKVNLKANNEALSPVDLNLLQTAMALDYILVTDDQKLLKIAHRNGAHGIDTPHFIHRLVMESKLSEEKALEILNQLKSIYNRTYVIEKVIRDIKKWG
ncbi:hypothetical protein HY988_01295 [Candidatus Micrarchaeota archaeon]|nr:hypothetical protein [Candidatus Micrarchaeota archaeon]